jgi:hypothetical protein
VTLAITPRARLQFIELPAGIEVRLVSVPFVAGPRIPDYCAGSLIVADFLSGGSFSQLARQVRRAPEAHEFPGKQAGKYPREEIAVLQIIGYESCNCDLNIGGEGGIRTHDTLPYT